MFHSTVKLPNYSRIVKKKEIFIPIPARVLNVAISFSGGICGPRILI